MADFPINGRNFAPQAGSYQAYQGYQQPPMQPAAPEAPQQPKGNPVKAVAALTGAGLSLALLIGVGVWGYQLISRDVAGVPVVRAVQGEMRVRPENPGGSQASNQGLAVNDVAAAGGTAGPSDRIVLAPEPIDLSKEDTPLIDQLAAAQPKFEPKPTEVITLTRPQVEAPSADLDPKMASIEALAAQIAAGATPLTTQGQVRQEVVQTSIAEAPSRIEPIAAPTPQAPTTLTLSATAISSSVPGVAISVRPKVRPAGIRTASLSAATVAAPVSSAVSEVDPASIPAGTRLVQLGAYESAEVARSEWTRFSSRFGEYMEGKQRVVQRAESGGRTFYRLRALGFSDLADARRFCSALTAQNTDCIPVVTR
ncbi:SPOR domain-containing protein [Planktotalea sp.]|uniref:SPOR domain-containing protein n=1 Tax=Planktotalea sp. TaxID=2029877 RepID=UPI003299D73C